MFAVAVLFIYPVAAFPVNTVNIAKSSSGYTCLFGFLIIFVLLAISVILKRVFIKKRRHPHYIGDKTASESSFSQSSALHTASSSGSERLAGVFTSGILVGLFGSPGWETRRGYTAQLERQLQHQNYRPPILARVSQEKLRHISPSEKSTDNTAPGAEEMGSLPTPTNACGCAPFEHLPALEHQTVHLICLPAQLRLAPTRTSLETCLPQRRLSLPNFEPRKRIQNGRRYQSVSIERFDLIPWASSLRLVKAARTPELALPLSLPSPCTSFAVPPPTNASHDSGTKTITEDMTPLSEPRQTSFVVQGAVQKHLRPEPITLGLAHISYPLAVQKTRKPRPEPIVMRSFSQKPPTSSQGSANSYQKTRQSPILSHLSLATISSSEDAWNLPNQTGSPETSPNLSAFPYPPLGPVIPLRLKSRNRKPIHVRRSPTTAPSPLRSMILPGSSESISRHSSDPKAAEKGDLQQESPPTSVSHSAVGKQSDLLKSRSYERQVWPNSGMDASQYPLSNENATATQSPSRVSSDNPNMLLNIIRELVEETSEWDSSLFVSDGFRNMIHESRVSLCRKPCEPDEAYTDERSHKDWASYDPTRVPSNPPTIPVASHEALYSLDQYNWFEEDKVGLAL